MELDVLIFGGGAAGLWLLDQLVRRGDRVLLLEAGRLGQGQTIASQGIIHGGLKYTLQGLLTPAAREIRDMPRVWRQCLAGRRTPDLRNTRVRSESCYLWRNESLRSRLGMLGARVGLQVAPTELAAADRPPVLAGCPGPVARLDEQVVSPASLIADLARQHHPHLLRVDSERSVTMKLSGPKIIDRVTIAHPDTRKTLELQPKHVVLTAGAGNSPLRRQCDLAEDVMQCRPLHMVLVRGNLPILNGHCVDGARTRVTITTDTDSSGRTVWQVGGQLAEDGVALDEQTLVRRARQELTSVLPGVDLSVCDWAGYRVNRAERLMPRGGRPDTATVISEGNIHTVWPTKLALAPQAAQMVAARLPLHFEAGVADNPDNVPELQDWPRPEIALPPWEAVPVWHRLEHNVHAGHAA